MKEKFRNGSVLQRILIAFAEGGGLPNHNDKEVVTAREIKMYSGGLEGIEQARGAKRRW